MLKKAYEFAAEAHKNQVRKGTDIPYIVHPAEVRDILGQLGCGEEVMAAGLLHDTLEDTKTTAEELREIFGAKVAELVAFCSEDKSLPWEQRKEHTLKSLEGAGPAQLLLVFADKLSNIRAMRRDYEAVGDELWKRFNRPYEKQKWVFGLYNGLFRKTAAAGSEKYRELTEEFAAHCTALFGCRADTP